MKKLLLSVLVASSALLVSCESGGSGPLIGKNADITFLNKAHTVNVNVTELGYLIDGKHDFLLYVTSDFCSACQNFKPVFDEYLLSYETMVYEYNGSSYEDGWSKLHDTYPSIFTEVITPSLYLFEGGGLNYTFTFDKLPSVKQLNALIRDNSRSLNHYYINSYEAFLGFKSNDPANQVLDISFKSTESSKSYLEHYRTRPKKRLYVVNYAFMSNDEIDKITEAGFPGFETN